MRPSNSSKFRLVLLAVLLAGSLFMTGSAFGQDAAAGAEPANEPLGLIDLIFGHIDGVTITVGILSVVGLTLIIQGFLKNRPSVLMPEETTNQIREMIGQRKFKELIEFTETDPSFVSKALNPALKRAPSFSSMKEAMETALGEQTAEQFRKIEYLNIIGNLGPLLGLLGTVLGMIQAFSAMQAAGGNANPAELAGGISTALVHTFLGLFLAVPCLAAFGILRTIVDRLTVRGALVAEELLLMIKPQEKPTATASPARAAAAPQPARKAPLPTPAPSPAV
ncbi:MAG TPA: MotA/TolQ/ExbB proton channel family protein [Tepidisphaeraceae bacterium]|nr:MotA/TolQ/ExbB proton channel family protein [Tepidisphaeraceae bacterium]